MMRLLALLVIIAGITFLSIGGYQYFQTAKAQDRSLSEAYKVLNDPQFKESFDDKSVENIPFHPHQGETVGILSIPKIDGELPIIEGTDEDELEKGVGHYKGTAYPSEQDQIVLSGHRDTVFRRMGELEIGDILTIQLPYGNFSYKIEHTQIVDADDRTIIRSTAPDEVLTVTTCYPFSYIGDAPDRYIITATPVKNEHP